MTKKAIAGYVCSEYEQERERQREQILKSVKENDDPVRFYNDSCDPDTEKKLGYLGLIMDMQLDKLSMIIVDSFEDISSDIKTLEWLNRLSVSCNVPVISAASGHTLNDVVNGLETTPVKTDSSFDDEVWDDSGLDDEAVDLIFSKCFE